MKIMSKRVNRVGSLLLASMIAATLSPAAIASAPGAGPLDAGAVAPAATQTVSIVLKVRNAEQLDAFIRQSVDPSSPNYHRFLSVSQFRDRFAPSSDQMRRVTGFLGSLGITINEVYADNLVISATGTVAQFNQAFSTSIHEYVEADGKRFRHPNDDGDHVPGSLADIVLYVSGLNTLAGQFQPKHHSAAATGSALGEAVPTVVLPSGNGTATGVPGSFTVGDVANTYGVNPLYSAGITGRGRTVGIVTLANFLPADAYNYWDAIGLPTKPNRITQVHVDGGAPLSSADGSGETSLDVEQSGGLAPDANVVVYDAPNTEAGFIDVFYKAVSENKADTLSVSWGSPEIYNFAIPYVSTDTRALFTVYHQAFAEAAAQGISMFAASGDSGAYDTDRSLPYPYFSKLLTVDLPASDPYLTAAGGTTLPGPIQRRYGVVNVPTEQVWGWDYFNDYLVTNYGPDYKDYYFAVGGGGGVSVYWPMPFYQEETSGIRRSAANQAWTYYPNGYPDTTGALYLTSLPANFRGRNVPDISLNSDPYTGFLIYSTTDGGWSAGWGGTSFAAPQLNGITALLSQAKGSRLGLLNPQLYALQGAGSAGHKPIVDITAGDNWYYAGVRGYEPGAGLGVINAAELAKRLK
jgi:kumamolisin